ncbi:hypothetical protein [Bacillus sp. BP-3]|uniref:hypothetical protein n=1 Tax=Bacillus sp. BP-3 TaxID=3022773 RepID=UPI00232F07E4|nr:hypothetical protein [Bacillus sp. BP-3]MDC2866413.1 hypothetical protein [Bacillus sp. BP-3]
MLNESTYETEIIETGEKLPFVLKVIVGAEEKGEHIILNKLCASPTTISSCVYKVQELKPLRLHIQSQYPIKITFIWNKVYEGQKQHMEWKYELHEKQRTILLYEHGKTDYLYPWRCGVYHFEVQIGDELFYGAFQIVPKNFFDDQLELIQQYVKSVLNEIILDRGYYKKTFVTFAEIEDYSYMRMLRMLPQKMKKVKQLYYEVQQKVNFEDDYIWEMRERKQGRKSTIMREKKPYEKWYNRRFREKKHDKMNGYVKYKTKLFYNQLLEIDLFLHETIQKLERAQQTRRNEKKAVHTILQTIERNGSVTERDKQKYRNIHLLKDTDLRKIAMKIQEYKVLYIVLQSTLTYFSSLLHTPFWREVREETTLTTHSLSPVYYQLLHQLEFSSHRNELEPSFLFVYKPTFLIYEYYAYFTVVAILQELGFNDYMSIAEQIQSYFYLDGLQDGTTIILEDEDLQLHVVFNDLIETHPLIALSKQSHFYNGEDTKKPDIRIDCYKRGETSYEYQSSIIVEVKYSPMYNIFQPVGNTKATEQMYKYWSIKYVEEQNGKRLFHRRAIYEVICVYPGSNMHAKKIETGCGVFLQLYPYKTKKGEERLAGKKELVNIFQYWLTGIKK